MEYINSNCIIELSNPGVVSRQLLNSDNSNSENVTITEVHLKPNAEQPRHKHENSEQIWYCIKGQGTLLVSENKEQKFTVGDVVRFEKNDIHGLRNNSVNELVYISVTSPPINFSYAYKNKKLSNSQ